MKAKPQKKPTKTGSKQPQAKKQSPDFLTQFSWYREFFESLCVALILAFLFRAFVAEAFVIPTGSMAPTLMGAHKDVTCEQCGYTYQAGASDEFDKLGFETNQSIVSCICPNCRFEMTLNLKTDANHDTFSGDRILVSKFSYLAKEPSRWDVIVFKYPLESRQNYIKRLIGRPNEDVRVKHGNVYIRDRKDSTAQFEIARKPENIVTATLQHVYDTKYQSPALVKAKVPSRWQPSPSAGTAWQIQNDVNWSANCDATGEKRIQWARYFHRVISTDDWQSILTGSAPSRLLEKYPTRLVTDFCHYNSSTPVNKAKLYRNGTVSNDFDEDAPIGASFDATQIGRKRTLSNDGLHWVNDLAEEFDITIESDTGSIWLEAVQEGVAYRCQIDIQSGKATLTALKGSISVDAFQSNDGYVESIDFDTSISGAGNYRIRFANVDHQLHLWVNGKIQNTNGSGRFNPNRYLTDEEHYPHWLPSNPLDAAPLAIGVQEAKVAVTRGAVYRDIYYVATDGRRNTLVGAYTDYKKRNERVLASSAGDLASGIRDPAVLRDTIVTNPTLWKSSPYFLERESVEFSLDEDQYFPMGDNSEASLDARAWTTKYVPERLLIGRAVIVFWPHAWNRPIPFLPNFQRIRLIR